MSDSVLDVEGKNTTPPTPPATPPAEPEPTPPAEPEPKKGGDDTPPPFADGDWRKEAGDERLQKFKTAKDLAKAYFELETWKGTQNKVTKLSKDATLEERAKFAKEVLGVPDLDKYDVKIEAKTDEQKALISSLKKVAHENGVLPAQLEAILKAQGKEAEVLAFNKQKASDAQQAEALQAFRKEQGTKWDMTIKTAQTATKAFIDADMNKAFKDMGLDKNPQFIKLLATVGGELKEDSAILNGETSKSIGMTEEEYNIQLTEIMADKDYFDAQSPRQSMLVHKARSIHEKIANLKQKK